MFASTAQRLKTEWASRGNSDDIVNSHAYTFVNTHRQRTGLLRYLSEHTYAHVRASTRTGTILLNRRAYCVLRNRSFTVVDDNVESDRDTTLAIFYCTVHLSCKTSSTVYPSFGCQRACECFLMIISEKTSEHALQMSRAMLIGGIYCPNKVIKFLLRKGVIRFTKTRATRAVVLSTNTGACARENATSASERRLQMTAINGIISVCVYRVDFYCTRR